MFQFPNGSIKRETIIISVSVKSMFQFPNGSIKSRAVRTHLVLPFCFNSLMVRLKVCCIDESVCDPIVSIP